MTRPRHQFGESPTGFSPRIISYDSEFVREKSYKPKLALLQTHQPENPVAHLFDPLSSHSRPPWSALLEHNAPLVMHSGSQDLELIYLYTGTLPNSIRDTQLGFALLQPKQFVSYADIVNHYLAINLPKEHTRSNWLKRPLSQAQLDYAADDVIYLSKLYPMLCADLQAQGRLSWWQEECQRMLEEAKVPKPRYRWYRLSAAPKLKGIETAIADLLVEAREQLAETHDLPRRHIANDKLLIELAKKQPITIEMLAAELPATHQLWQALPTLTQGYERLSMLTDYPDIPRPPTLTAQARKRYNHLLAHTQQCAKMLNIAPDMLISNRQLRYFCAYPNTDAIITQGWRAPFYQAVI